MLFSLQRPLEIISGKSISLAANYIVVPQQMPLIQPKIETTCAGNTEGDPKEIHMLFQ